MNKMVVDKEIIIDSYTGEISYTLSNNIINIKKNNMAPLHQWQGSLLYPFREPKKTVHYIIGSVIYFCLSNISAAFFSSSLIGRC